jgi:hypothetical protein
MRLLKTLFVAIPFFAAQCGVGLVQDNKVSLTGTARSSLVAGAINGCLREQQRDPLPLPANTISEYCRCYANGVADRLSIDELKAQQAMSRKEQDAAMLPVVQAAARACYAIMKKSLLPQSN